MLGNSKFIMPGIKEKMEYYVLGKYLHRWVKGMKKMTPIS